MEKSNKHIKILYGTNFITIIGIFVLIGFIFEITNQLDWLENKVNKSTEYIYESDSPWVYELNINSLRKEEQKEIELSNGVKVGGNYKYTGVINVFDSKGNVIGTPGVYEYCMFANFGTKIHLTEIGLLNDYAGSLSQNFIGLNNEENELTKSILVKNDIYSGNLYLRGDRGFYFDFFSAYDIDIQAEIDKISKFFPREIVCFQ